ncbi:crossover junction endodeoxyribonuclease RuvC [Neorickettsia sennetsu]|uniref:Crossover junction endodeoxyribonuclease RuvC n=1 Tax=Ehrlichia sennetsu (strain ATCC VR-367 / Miyayama) TaxID=222891 RepID=RUVC_EHRS3|nr:crossover junction endodeoxyribonuclease RuvC [Neorickettsia sennetsu]Q2GCH7.1 RecName: Full=Crossover junction endodeoxyribonuclease RuvC; AltName: Full=Holliday junction nuclease RuvC; AltName: Full=Holliday junction resolvase RuvC [Neorickettsia sennetsu str. Miyayama]ABD46339.1 crossover junction endodeoxyribonuclease RuvC [Neorickettsia sennetsu str. Miyayama]
MSYVALGVDPGLLRTGWAVVEYDGLCNVRYIDSGIVKTASQGSLSARLEKIHRGISDVIEKVNPSVAVLEKVFVNNNPYSSLNLAYCRGALILTLALKGLFIVEFAPSVLKKRITGNGRATKAQVKYMVEQLLGLDPCLSKYSDLYDALALAASVTRYDIMEAKGT